MHTTTIRIPEDLYKFLKIQSVLLDFKSTNDYINYILSQVRDNEIRGE